MSNETKTMKSLKERAKSFDVQLPLMEGREKGETKELIAQITSINEYGFIPNDAGEPYVVFTIKERPGKFYFGGSVLTARMLDLENEGYHDAIVAEGLPMLLTEEKSRKSNRMYTSVKFYPED